MWPNYHLAQVTVLALCSLSLSQNLTVDPNWREPSTTRSKSQRISIAQNAINAMLPQLDTAIGEFNGIGYWQSANVWSAMALQDQITGDTTNQATVVANLKLVFQLRKNYDKFGWWAQASYYAYKAYGDPALLNNSISTWNSVTNYVVTEAQALAGKTPVKNFTLEGSCDGVTMAGGVFWRPTIDDTSINSITTGLYLTLSAYLAEATGDTKYLNASILSAQWIKAHNINAGNIVLDTESGADCSRSPATWLFTYNSGKFIEALSVLAQVTKDTQWNQLMLVTAAASVKSKVWQGVDGVITEGSDNGSDNDDIGFKAVFVRGLREAFRRNPSNANLRVLLQSYIDVQYNALLELAQNGTFYSADWNGPIPQIFTSWGQLAALDALVAAVEVNN